MYLCESLFRLDEDRPKVVVINHPLKTSNTSEPVHQNLHTVLSKLSTYELSKMTWFCFRSEAGTMGLHKYIFCTTSPMQRNVVVH